MLRQGNSKSLQHSPGIGEEASPLCTSPSHWLVLEEEAGMVTAWVDGEAMVDTAWEEVMTVKEAETVSLLAGAAGGGSSRGSG